MRNLFAANSSLKELYTLKANTFIFLIHPILLIYLFLSIGTVSAQNKAFIYEDTSSYNGMLLLNRTLQIEITEAVNNMYNFKFEEAEREFNYIKFKYPEHPLPYFLLGLSQWWKIMPNPDDDRYDKVFLGFMDQAIDKAERMLKEDKGNREASFFLAAAHGFKGRLYSDRRSWAKATAAGKNALKHLDMSKKTDEEFFDPELLFGDALYNYYSVWIPENYPLLKPILVFFPKGDKELGLQQLKDVARNSFYSRTEAQYFLMRLLSHEEKDTEGGFQIAEYLYQTFPDNPYFHRFYTTLLYLRGRLNETEVQSLLILERISKQMPGYEATSGRYASFFMGHISEVRKDFNGAKRHYLNAVSYGEESEAQESGYFLYSLLNLGKLYQREGNKKDADKYFNQVKKYAKRKHPAHATAREYLKSKKI
jgi:tetratricopeptide (TPR) repeat protein